MYCATTHKLHHAMLLCLLTALGADIKEHKKKKKWHSQVDCQRTQMRTIYSPKPILTCSQCAYVDNENSDDPDRWIAIWFANKDTSGRRHNYYCLQYSFVLGLEWYVVKKSTRARRLDKLIIFLIPSEPIAKNVLVLRLFFSTFFGTYSEISGIHRVFQWRGGVK